jgi:D-sedoheptulose 7-phosphate isomerase
MDIGKIVQASLSELKETVEASAAGAGTIEQMARAVVEALQAGKKVLTAGNGGSAADALHMAEELTGRYKGNRRALPAVCLAGDPTALTCIGNDFGFEQVFARQVEALGAEGDVLVLFTSSGNSGNLIAALDAAKKRRIKTIALLGRDGGKLKGMADIEWIVPGKNGARAQEMHTVVLHIILEAVEEAFS